MTSKQLYRRLMQAITCLKSDMRRMFAAHTFDEERQRLVSRNRRYILQYDGMGGVRCDPNPDELPDCRIEDRLPDGRRVFYNEQGSFCVEPQSGE